MKCLGNFVYKSLEKRDGGEFTNAQGQAIKYDSSYVIKVDELTENGIYERKLKIDKNNQVLISKLKNLKAYDKIDLICDVVLFGANAKVVPVDIGSNNK